MWLLTKARPASRTFGADSVNSTFEKRGKQRSLENNIYLLLRTIVTAARAHHSVLRRNSRAPNRFRGRFV